MVAMTRMVTTKLENDKSKNKNKDGRNISRISRYRSNLKETVTMFAP